MHHSITGNLKRIRYSKEGQARPNSRSVNTGAGRTRNHPGRGWLLDLATAAFHVSRSPRTYVTPSHRMRVIVTGRAGSAQGWEIEDGEHRSQVRSRRM